ncbi:hypothetical protein RRG08_059983 [Elysia crispata]|uniref:Uncharacterized protein n=1 Tax=Elysia crispata TaxID=231223 RepID=A0AAE1ALY6_9GAST|nr:hypothetical protein RRG08_059983 [Elysia crispata]
MVDGMERFAPVVLTSRGVSISQSGRYMELLVADCGLELAFDGVHRVVVRVPKATHAVTLPPPPPQTISAQIIPVILVEPTPKQPKIITDDVIPPQTPPLPTPPRPTTPPPPVTTTPGGPMSPKQPSREASCNLLRP